VELKRKKVKLGAARKELQEENLELQERNLDISNSVNYAKRIQPGVLVAYSNSSWRYLVLVLWIILQSSNYIYKKYFKKGY